MNALVKNNEADVVNSEISMVKVRDSTRLGQRRSFALHPSLFSKVNERGKYESNSTLAIPLRSVLGKSRCSPIFETMPQPPSASLTMPACIAEPQITESPR